MCESRSSTTSCPERVCATTQTRLPCVPDVTKSPASLPSRSAAAASSRWIVGSSPQTSSPTSARAMASRISGVGSVSVSERRSTISCTRSPLRAQSLRRAFAPFRVPVLARELPEQRQRVGVAAFAEVHVGQERERLRDPRRAGGVLDVLLQSRPGAAQVALADVPRSDPHFLLREPTAADLDLRERVGRVAALGVILHQLLELIHR